MDAFEKASTGLTKKSRSRRYKKFKAQNERKRERQAASLFLPKPTYTPPKPKQPIRTKSTPIKTLKSSRVPKYVEKKTILDDLRDYRSSKIVSTISNSLATFVVKCGGRQWDNDTKNFVRSSIALAISEVTNKVMEKPLEIVKNVKLFIKVGKVIYKIITWIDKISKLWTTDDKSICTVMETNWEYIQYKQRYTRLAKSVYTFNADSRGMEFFEAIEKGYIPNEFFSFREKWASAVKALMALRKNIDYYAKPSYIKFDYKGKPYWVGANSLGIAAEHFELIAKVIEADLHKIGAVKICYCGIKINALS